MIDDKIKHYCWIKNLSCLVSAQYSGHDEEPTYCRFCLHGFCDRPIEGQRTRLQDAKRRRDEHEEEFFAHGGQRTSFPEEPYIEFKAI